MMDKFEKILCELCLSKEELKCLKGTARAYNFKRGWNKCHDLFTKYISESLPSEDEIYNIMARTQADSNFHNACDGLLDLFAKAIRKRLEEI